ncbi:MAG: ATPase [Alphaproteobacteria bacterium]|nr:ATPase [Alphaproteobacteria bacterium]MDE2630979.1 ATPase [Alphaproteobacteria bacterium]
MKRFYEEVAVGDGFAIFLDGKSVKTPMRATLSLPTRALAEAVAGEWRGQGETIRPETMPLTKLANTAIDRVAEHEKEVVEKIMAYANDLLCYRAEAPADLAARQNDLWNPLLDWAVERTGARLNTGVGVNHIAQPEETVAAFRSALAEHDPFVLTAVHSAATICGSLVLALALAEGRLDAEEAFALSQLDEHYQAEKWGVDEAAARRALALAGELDATARFMRLAQREAESPLPGKQP